MKKIFFTAFFLSLFTSLFALDNIILDCPYSTSSYSVTVTARLLLNNGPSCAPVSLNVIDPSGNPRIIQEKPCSNGQHSFEINFPASGNYSATASYAGPPSLASTCIITAFRPEQKTIPEIHPLLIALIAVAALFLARKKSS